MKISNQKKGFSLIELLVVISIMGILIGLSAFGLQGARQSARDARRVSDIEQIRSGLQLYKADCGGYPTSAEFPAAGATLSGDNSSVSCSDQNDYIVDRPDDPVPGADYIYVSPNSEAGASPVSYEICASREQGGANVSCGGSTSCGTGGCNYRVENP